MVRNRSINITQSALSLDGPEMDIDKAITPSEPPRRSRRLTTVVVAKQSSSHMETPVRKPTKRRSSTSPSQPQPQRGTKKAKAWTETKRNIVSPENILQLHRLMITLQEIPHRAHENSDQLVDLNQPPVSILFFFCLAC
jgi:hypothetical protein